jgi:hypothetical protein
MMKMTGTVPGYTPEFKRAVVQAYKSEPSSVVIGKRFSLHHSTVLRWVKKLNNGGNSNGNSGNGKTHVFETVEFEPLGLIEKPCGDTQYDGPLPEDAGGCGGEIDELVALAEKEYLSHLLKPENVSGTSTKDAAAIFKTLAEVEIKRSAHRLMMESAKNAGVRGTDGDGEGDELKPGLLDWERVVKRLLSEGDAE